MSQIPNAGPASMLLKLGAVLGLGLYAAGHSFYNVEGGHRAIVFNRLVGVKDKVYPEGTHLMIPWFERPVIYDVRARPHLVESTSGSRDLQMVKIGLRVLTRPVADELPAVYRTLAKQVAAQEAERAKFVVEKAEQDKRSAIIRAQGEAKSAQLIGQAIANNPAFITLRKIEAAREIASTMAHSSNKVMLSADNLLLNLQEMHLDNK
nr:prohibitin-1, mitochondrial-like isoform X1 [Tanacetum cinerariifolium]